MRIIDAYRRSVITYDQYLELLNLGHSPSSIYSTSYLPSVPTNSWTEILNWDTEGIGPKYIVVENLDALYDLECKVEVFIDDILARTDNSTFSDTWSCFINEPCTSIVVSIRSSEYGQTTSYDFAYTNEY